uniref:DUF4130 domain-containing protein n=1 Tax=Sphingobacterium sp. (strain 21) TaxID=743722 RepID=F4C8I9_SPHS2
MCVIIYDGTWEGWLTLVFEMFEFKVSVTAIYRNEQPLQQDIFVPWKRVTTDKSKAQRVWKGLQLRIPKYAQENLFCAFLSELPQIEATLCSAVCFYFSTVEEGHLAFGRNDVLTIHQTAKMVNRERHRMKAFTRFKKQKNGLYFAVIEPDFNVLPLINEHFMRRYADQRWLIYDTKRDYGIYYDLNLVSEVKLTNETVLLDDMVQFEEDEILYADLWQQYFKSTNIKERKNVRLHVQHVPKRYWKYLTEKSI